MRPAFAIERSPMTDVSRTNSYFQVEGSQAFLRNDVKPVTRRENHRIRTGGFDTCDA